MQEERLLLTGLILQLIYQVRRPLICRLQLQTLSITTAMKQYTHLSVLTVKDQAFILLMEPYLKFNPEIILIREDALNIKPFFQPRIRDIRRFLKTLLLTPHHD